MRIPLIASIAVLVLMGATAAPQPHVVAPSAIDAGRFLIAYGGCNECHTPGWNERKASIPESERLTGSTVGFQGTWGTSYPINLRLFFSHFSEARWIQLVREPNFPIHPPMPWERLQTLSDDDLHAIYAYVHSLGNVGPPVPDFVPPGKPVRTPVIVLTPVTPP